MKLQTGERLDDLQLQNLHIIQHPDRFCFGVDAVFLSDFVRVKNKERVLDLGTGTGILPILLSAKTKGQQFFGLEIQEECADMARRSVLHNHLEDKISIVQGDIKEAYSLFKHERIDVITCNPPYMIAEHGYQSIGDSIAIARHEILVSLEDIIRESSRLLLENKGRFYMIHKPFRLIEIVSLMSKYRIEPKRIQFIHPYIDKEPTMVMIEGIRGGKSRVTIEPPIVHYTRRL